MQYETTASPGAGGRDAGSSHGVDGAAGMDREQIVAGLFAWELESPYALNRFSGDDGYVRQLAAQAGPVLGDLRVGAAARLLPQLEPDDFRWGWRQLCEDRAGDVFPADAGAEVWAEHRAAVDAAWAAVAEFDAGDLAACNYDDPARTARHTVDEDEAGDYPARDVVDQFEDEDEDVWC
jgi:hypothetical protein